ncbi:MAG: hypothetical protein GY866_25835 [Proteobacteria bacterium]|nr:hypothetical protein [Pseudomonadota bacterium]
MNLCRPFWKACLLSVVFLSFLYINVLAEQELVLAELDPESTHFGAFNSFKHTLLLISLEQNGKRPFGCLPNQYIFYNYRAEEYFAIFAGNVKINSDYTKVFRTKIHTLGGISPKNQKEWKRQARTLMKAFNISSQTMERGKMKSTNSSTVCWQQPELMDLHNKSLSSYPYLAANLCKSTWCSELYWVDSSHIKFWIHLDPKEFHLIRLNTETGGIKYEKHGPVFYRSEMRQMNAPRANLVTEENMSKNMIVLTSKKDKNIRLSWKSVKNGKIRVSLRRSKIDKTAVNDVRKKIDELVRKKRIPQALQLIKFAFWLDPENTDIKIERLKVYASLLLLEKIYDSLKNDFSQLERFNACQKLHLEKSFEILWKRNDFIKNFKEICS